MQFIQGATIFMMNGKQVGRIDRVVINRKTQVVTHLVIRTGAFITQDKVVPIDLVCAGEQDQPVLRCCTSQLAQMTDFGMTHYRAMNDAELPWDEEREPRLLPPVSWCLAYPALSVGLYVGQPNMRGTRVNIPASTVAVREGAKVVSADGQHLGHVERVLTSPPTDRATYFQLSKGWPRKKKLVPFEWVDQLDEDQVRLAVGARTVEDLPE